MYLLTSRDYCKKKLVISTDLTNPKSAPGYYKHSLSSALMQIFYEVIVVQLKL